MKKYFFLSGLPRAGNTLLSSILNQNPDLSVSANSFVCDILYQGATLQFTDFFENFPDCCPRNAIEARGAIPCILFHLALSESSLVCGSSTQAPYNKPARAILPFQQLPCVNDPNPIGC